MPDYSAFKLPVVAGINDNPLPINYNNNGRGPNGSYLTEKYNAFISSLEEQSFILSGLIENPKTKIYLLDYVSEACSLSTIHLKCNSGSGTISFLKNGVAITDLQNLTVTTSISTISLNTPHSLSLTDTLSIAYLNGVSTDLFFKIIFSI